MRRKLYILALALMGMLALSCSPISAQSYSQDQPGAQVDVGVFYDGLAPYGDWVEIPNYGWSWAPRVDRDWRPYTRGQWVMTDDGWFWDSDEQFGWATYHYGRWFNDEDYGWVWIPGTEWAPAWVSWRHGNGYTGWAPLPPRATWQTRAGLSISGLDIDAFIGSDDYAFVQDRAFMDRGLYQRLLPRTQNVTIINATNNVTRYAVVNQRVVNSGIPVADVERAVGRSVPRARTVDLARADAPRSARADEVAVFRPQVRAAPERRPAQGRSLVKGEAPPPLWVERRQVRQQERQQRGNQPEVTAKAVQNQRPAGQPAGKEPGAVGQPLTPRTDAPALLQDAQRQRDQSQQDAVRQHANDQRHQELDAQAAQAAKRMRDAQQVQQQRDQVQRSQQQLEQQRARQANDAQIQAARRVQDVQQVQQQRDQVQRGQQQLEQQRARQASDAQAQAAQHVQGAQQAHDQAQGHQQQSDQHRAQGAQQQGHSKASPTPAPAEHKQ